MVDWSAAEILRDERRPLFDAFSPHDVDLDARDVLRSVEALRAESWTDHGTLYFTHVLPILSWWRCMSPWANEGIDNPAFDKKHRFAQEHSRSAGRRMPRPAGSVTEGCGLADM